MALRWVDGNLVDDETGEVYAPTGRRPPPTPEQAAAPVPEPAAITAERRALGIVFAAMSFLWNGTTLCWAATHVDEVAEGFTHGVAGGIAQSLSHAAVIIAALWYGYALLQVSGDMLTPFKFLTELKARPVAPVTVTMPAQAADAVAAAAKDIATAKPAEK